MIEPTALPTQSDATTPSGDTPRPATPPASTPLLDADIRRVEDVIRQHSESLRLGDATEPLPGAFMVLPTPSIPDWEGSKPSGPMTEPAKNPVLVAPPQQHPEEPSPLPISLLHGQDESSIVTTRVSVPIPSNDQVTNPARTAAPERSSSARPEPPRDPESESKQDVAIERAEYPVQPNPVDVAGPTQDQRPPMRITELKLCRKVERFGLFEPLDSTVIKTGRPIRLLRRPVSSTRLAAISSCRGSRHISSYDPTAKARSSGSRLYAARMSAVALVMHASCGPNQPADSTRTGLLSPPYGRDRPHRRTNHLDLDSNDDHAVTIIELFSGGRSAIHGEFSGKSAWKVRDFAGEGAATVTSLPADGSPLVKHGA